MIRQILLDLNYNRYMIELGVYIIGCLLALGLLIGIYFFFKADPDLHNYK